MTKARVKQTTVVQPDNPTEVIVGWTKPAVDAEGKTVGGEVYIQELFSEVTSTEVFEGTLTVNFGKGDYIDFANGTWFFNRYLADGRPEPTPEA